MLKNCDSVFQQDLHTEIKHFLVQISNEAYNTNGFFLELVLQIVNELLLMLYRSVMSTFGLPGWVSQEERLLIFVTVCREKSVWCISSHNMFSYYTVYTQYIINPV